MRGPLLLATAAFLLAQEQQPALKISVTTNLVIVNVDVRDRQGKPIEGLTAQDFVVTEDGKPQKISVFEYQRLETDVPPPEPSIQAASKPAEEAKPKAEKPVPKKEITPSAPGQVRYRDRRLMVLFFDFASMPPADQVRAQNAALKFIDEQMTPADMVAIMAFTNQLQVMEDFTNDKERLRAAIKAFRIGEGDVADVESADEETAEDTGEAFTADETEFNVFNTDRKLSALESAAKLLASLPEKKALVYFSSGVGRTGVENESQLRSTINAALRANVAFYPVDARGLTASAPAGDASRGSSRGTGIFSGATQRQVRERFNSQQETLYTLAGDTGGKALLDSNDLTLGIRQAQKDISSYYILGYYSTNPAQDGKFRRIKVSVKSHPQAKLDYRSGYFAPKEFKKFDAADKERQLEEALLLGDPLTDLPMALEVDYFRMSKGQYFVPVSIKIPGSAMELARSGRAEEAELDFIGQVRDNKGRVVGAVRDMIKVRLQGETAGKLAQRNLGYDSGFILPPGDYSIKFLARENVTGKMGTFETKFTVPDLLAENKWLRTSSVVLANQREPLSAAVGAAEKNRKLLALHPLVEEGQKLVPSITKVFRKDQNLYVYVEVYDPAISPESKTPSIMANVSFFRGRAKAFETEMLRVRHVSEKRPSTAPVRFQVPLNALKPGRYTCQVSLVDEYGKKFAFHRSPLIVLE